MAAILLGLFGGCEVIWEVPRVQAVVWIVPEKPAPKVELFGNSGHFNCANGQCGVPRRGVWRRRR